MHKSTEEPNNNMVNGFCNPYNALFVSQNSQETNESLNVDQDHETLISEEDCIKKDMNYRNYITVDLLKQIESNSPIRNDKQTQQPRIEHSKFFMQNSGEQHPSPINSIGNFPSFYPKKTNLWKHSNGSLPPIFYPFIHDRQFPMPNERYIPQGLPRAVLTPKNQCLTFSNFHEIGWSCISCRTINSEMKNQCYKCNCLKFIPSSTDKRKNTPVQIPSPNYNNNTNTNANANEGTTISLTLKEISQINQMQYNQLKKINQLKEFHGNEREKKYNTPVLSSNLKEKFESESGIISKKKKPFAERPGDWVCVKCKNLNFSFRSACNRCHTSKSENDKLYEQYMNNLMNYCKVNDILQLKYSSPNTSFPQWINTANNSQGIEDQAKTEAKDSTEMRKGN